MMKYWSLPDSASNGLYRLPLGDKYLLFISDCGGFNNIRMVFEYVLIIAWLTRRTLVIPPPSGWYLIDFGPFARMKPDPSDDRVTDYDEFFDIEHLRAAVPIISTDDFRKLEGERLKIPSAAMKADLKTQEGRHIWKEWIKDSNAHPTLNWEPLSKVIYWVCFYFN